MPEELRDCVLLAETLALEDAVQKGVLVPQLALTLGLDDSDTAPE